MTSSEPRFERAAGRLADERHPHRVKGSTAPATPRRALVTLERMRVQRHAGAPTAAAVLQVAGRVVLNQGRIAAGTPARPLVGTRRLDDLLGLIPPDVAPSPTTLTSSAKERHR